MSKHEHGKPRAKNLNAVLMSRKGGAHDEKRLHIAERPKARSAWKKEVEAVLSRANNSIVDEDELEMEY